MVIRSLQSWGWLTPVYSAQDLKSAVRRMQQYLRVPLTGLVEDLDTEILTSRRCSVPDHLPGACRHQASAYSWGCKWNKKDLTFKHVSFNPTMSQSDMKETFRAACDAWEEVCGLKFTEVGSGQRADINVGWERIDGPGGTLAYAYLPGECGGSLAGTLRVDLGDDWKPGQNGRESNLWQTLVHELGHIIGFYHSNLQDSIMWPYSNGGGTKISEDDAAGAVALYGPPRPSTQPPVTIETIPLVYRGEVSGVVAAGGRENKTFWIEAPVISSLVDNGAEKLKVSLRAESGDLDVYSAWDRVPVVVGELDSSDDYDHGSWTPGGAEDYTIDLSQNKLSDLFFLVQAYSGRSDFVLSVTAV